MIGGVSFQPGTNGEHGQQNGQGNGARPSAGGVQEAIKILSLRLPKVVGAQAAVPMPLLTSQGSGGNPMVDSIVSQVMSRVPGAQPSFSAPPQPFQPPAAMPDFSALIQQLYRAPRVSIGERPQVPTRQEPSVDVAPNPYPVPRGPEQQAPAIDYAPQPAQPPQNGPVFGGPQGPTYPDPMFEMPLF